MARFIKNIILMLIYLTLILGGLTALVFHNCIPQYTRNFQASFLDKMDRLYRINEPKIILVGNSNLSFGMDSELLSAELGMPVVNLGLNGDLGNAFHEDMARQCIKQGDLVIVCHSDYNDTDRILDPALAWITIEDHYDYWSVIRPKDIPLMLTGLPKYLERATDLYVEKTGNRESDGPYTRSAFNELGDNVYPREQRICDLSEFEDPVAPEYSRACVSRLNDLNAYCLEQGAVMVVAGWPIPDGDYNFPKQVYGDFGKELDEVLDCPVISDFKDYCTDYDFFYDSNLHLNKLGVEMRTKLLIEDVKRFWGVEEDD